MKSIEDLDPLLNVQDVMASVDSLGVIAARLQVLLESLSDSQNSSQSLAGVILTLGKVRYNGASFLRSQQYPPSTITSQSLFLRAVTRGRV